MEGQYERLLTNRDIRELLNVSGHMASKLLKRYGWRVGVKRVITQPAFRLLQLEGKVAEFMRRPGHDHI